MFYFNLTFKILRAFIVSIAVCMGGSICLNSGFVPWAATPIRSFFPFVIIAVRCIPLQKDERYQWIVLLSFQIWFFCFWEPCPPCWFVSNQEKWREKYCDQRDTLSGLWQVQAARGGGVALVFAPALWWPCTPVFLLFTLVSHPFPLWVWVEPSMWEPSFHQTEIPVLGKLLTTLPWTLAL